MRPRNLTVAGFTLLEMLIVLVLLSLLATTLTGAIFLGVTSRARVTAMTSDQADFGAFARVLMDQLRFAYPDWINAGRYQEVDFTGGSDQLQFLAPALMVQGTGLAEYNLSTARVSGRLALLLTSSFTAGGDANGMTTTFASGLSSVSFAYFGVPRGGTEPIWQDRWAIRSKLPELISVKVNFPKGDRRFWPAILIRPEIDADVTCEIDVATHRCLGR